MGEQALDRSFPEDYRTFMTWSNGGEGAVGASYLSLWPLQDIPEWHEGHRVARYLPDVLAIGSDGGSQYYGLDYGRNPDMPSLIIVDFGDLDPASARELGIHFSARYTGATR